MTRRVGGGYLWLIVLVPAVSLSAAERPREPVGNKADRERAAKDCEVYLHDGLEALAEHREAEAERWLKQARDAAETLGPESTEMARALGGLGALALIRKDFAKAESLLGRSLDIREKIAGPEDASVGLALHNLAAAKLALKKYDEAEPIARRAVAIREKAPDADDEDLADALNQLALIYALKGQIPRAEEVFRRAVELREKAQGPDHPDLAKALMNMAAVRASRALSVKFGSLLKSAQNLGDEAPPDPSELEFRAAEALIERALAIREKSLGPEHPDTIATLETLASCHQLQEDHARAEPLLLRLLALQKQVFGPDDRRVADTLAELAGIAMERGRYRDAESWLRLALTIREQARRAKPDDKETGEALETCARDLRKVVRSAEVMEDPRLRPTEDDLKYLNGLAYATKEPNVASLFNSQYVQVIDESIGDAGLVHLRGLVNAERLRVSADRITDDGLVHLERLTGLKTLILIGSKIRGPGLAHLKGMTELEELNLSASFLLDDAGLAHLPPLPRLKKLSLDFGKIGDAALPSLERFPALEELHIDGTKVSEAGLEKLKRVRPGLKVSHKAFDDVLPAAAVLDVPPAPVEVLPPTADPKPD